MDRVIATTLVIVGCVVSAVLLVHSVYPTLAREPEGADVENAPPIAHHVRIIHATVELDEDGVWHDANGNGLFDVHVWAKNVGTSTIARLEQTDVFFGRPGDVQWVPYAAQARGTYPRWVYALESGSVWAGGVTVRFSIQYPAPQPTGDYFVKVVAPDGASDEYRLGF